VGAILLSSLYLCLNITAVFRTEKAGTLYTLFYRFGILWGAIFNVYLLWMVGLEIIGISGVAIYTAQKTFPQKNMPFTYGFGFIA